MPLPRGRYWARRIPPDRGPAAMLRWETGILRGMFGPSPRPPATRWPGILALLALTVALPGHLRAQKTDVIILTNGDRITGEIKGVSHGKLDYSTDDAGRPSIEWVKVIRVTSVKSFEVEARSGWRYYGHLAPSDRDGALVVAGARTDTLRIVDVVLINQLGASFLRRTKAFLDVGFSFAKANLATTLSVDGEVDYRGPKFGGTVAFNSYLQGQETVPTTTRGTLSTQVVRFLPKRWSAGVFGKLEQNDELNLLARVGLGGGATRMVKQSNRAELALSAGLVGTRERFSLVDSAAASPDTTATNLEGVLNLTWSAFRFDSPKLDFSTSLTAYPGLSDLGRLRADLDLRLKYELVKDFFVGLTFTDTFDSRPPDPNASKNDFVTSLTIGWSYRR